MSDTLTKFEGLVNCLINSKIKEFVVRIEDFSLYRSKSKKKRGKEEKNAFLYLTNLMYGMRNDSFIVYMQFEDDEIKKSSLAEMDFIFSDKKEAELLLQESIKRIVFIKKCLNTYQPNLDFGGLMKPPVFEDDLSKNRKASGYYVILCDSLNIKKVDTIQTGLNQIKIKTLELNELKGNNKISNDDITVIGIVLKNMGDVYEEVICDGIPMSDETFSFFSSAVFQNKNISMLTMSNCQVTSKCINQIPDSLKEYHPNLKELNFSNNPKIGDSGIEKLSTSLGNTSVKSICLSNCGFSYKAMASLSHSLSTKHTINSVEHIDLSENLLKKTGSVAISKPLMRLKNLQTLNLARSDLNVTPVLEALMSNPSMDNLKELNLSAGRMNKKSVNLIAQLLRETKSLVRLTLRSAKLSACDFKTIFNGLMENPDAADGKTLNLTLDFSGNNFEGIKGGFITKPCRCVRVLNLSDTNLKAKGIIELLEDLTNLKQLHTLKIDKNVRISHFGSSNDDLGKALVELVRMLPSLEYISIEGNGEVFCVKNGLNAFFEALAINNSLLRLDMTGNKFSDNEFEILANGLASNQSLKMLNIDNNKANYTGMMKLLNVMKISKNLVAALPKNDIAILLKTKNPDVELNLKLAYDEIENRFKCNANKAKDDVNFINDYEFTKKNKNCLKSELEKMKGQQFGVDLIDLAGTMKIHNFSARIPTVLVTMSDYLFSHDGHQVRGIFRLAPDMAECERVQQQFNDNIFQDCSDVNCIANSIKVWFRMLPRRLFNESMQEEISFKSKFLKENSSNKNLIDKGTAEKTENPESKNGKNDKKNGLKSGNNGTVEKIGEGVDENIIEQVMKKGLREPYLSLFIWLLDLLSSIAANSSVNMMTPKNLAIVFVPNLIAQDNNFAQSEEASLFLENAIKWRIKNPSVVF